MRNKNLYIENWKLEIGNWKLIFLLSIFCFLFSIFVFAQTQKKKDLEKKKLELQKEINYQNKLLQEVKKNKNRSMVQLAILNNRIARQQELIAAIGKELGMIEGDISETQNRILQKETELKILKDNYAKIIFAAYKSRDSYSRLMFFLASADFNQAIQRIKYMQIYSEAGKKQATLIEDAQRKMQTMKQELENRKVQQNKTLSVKQSETANLSKQKKDKELTLTELQKKEKNIRDEISKKKQQAEKLKKAIEKVIEDEIKKARDFAKKNNTKIITLTPEEKELSNDFESNKGKLPWPLSQGVITESFGKHPHPDMPNIEISNNGVNIGTHKGEGVRAVFNGTVSAVASVGGIEGKVVIIKHGEYLSVYSNLEQANVKTGDKVKTKQPIGKVLTDDNSVTELHFEIWKGQSMLNPESWITK